MFQRWRVKFHPGKLSQEVVLVDEVVAHLRSEEDRLAGEIDALGDKPEDTILRHIMVGEHRVLQIIAEKLEGVE